MWRSQNANEKDLLHGCFPGALIDETFYSRYRFAPAEHQPGTASGLVGVAYSLDPPASDALLVRLQCLIIPLGQGTYAAGVDAYLVVAMATNGCRAST